MPKTMRFTELLSSHEGEIYRYVYRMTGNTDDARDLLQDTFLKAFEAFARLPENANHRAWLYKIAYRQALNHFRSTKRRAAAPMEQAKGVQDEQGNPESLSETRRLVRALNRLIHELTPRQRSALLLKKYEGLSYRSVAAILGVTEENARAHVYQAMRKVRNGLRSEGTRK